MKPRLPHMLVALAALHQAMADHPQLFQGPDILLPVRPPQDPTFGLVKKEPLK